METSQHVIATTNRKLATSTWAERKFYFSTVNSHVLLRKQVVKSPQIYNLFAICFYIFVGNVRLYLICYVTNE